MSVLSVVLSIAWPGAATPATHHLGRPELWNLVISMAILGLLYRWIAVAKREQAARLREKVVPFPQRHVSRLVMVVMVVL
ncbi:MAG TPA: hypothetical protein VI589_16045, partial [Vicinamibacteria bacterium]